MLTSLKFFKGRKTSEELTLPSTTFSEGKHTFIHFIHLI